MAAPVVPVDLSCWIAAQSAGTLTVAYRVTNRLPSSIYLFNQLYRARHPDSTYLVDPELVYVELAQSGVHLYKWIPPIPEDVSVEEAIIPVTTLVRAGETFEEAITLPVPVSRLDPYRPRRGSPGGLQPVTFGWLDVTIGYLPVSEIGSREPHRVRTSLGDAIWVHALASAQTVLRSAPITTPVPVIPDQLPPPPRHRCPRCGATNIGYQQTCLRCSAPLMATVAPQPPPLPPAVRHCVRCGAAISPAARFCGRCGTSQ